MVRVVYQEVAWAVVGDIAQFKPVENSPRVALGQIVEGFQLMYSHFCSKCCHRFSSTPEELWWAVLCSTGMLERTLHEFLHLALGRGGQAIVKVTDFAKEQAVAIVSFRVIC